MKKQKPVNQTVIKQESVKMRFGTEKNAVKTVATVTMYSISDGNFKVNFDGTTEYLGTSKEQAETVYNHFLK